MRVMGFMKYVPSSAARTAKAALVLCFFDEEDAWSAPRTNDGDDKFEHENDISAFSFASRRVFEVWCSRARRESERELYHMKHISYKTLNINREKKF